MKLRHFVLLAALTIILGAAARTPQKVACIGNSITYGSLLPDRQNECYPAVLQRLLGDDYIVGNFGRPGATLLMRGHRPYVLQPEFAEALTFRPDIALIKLGINDTDPRDWPDFRDDFARDFNLIVDSLRAVNPNVRIIMSRLAAVTSGHPRFSAGTVAWRDSVNEVIENFARGKGLELADIGAKLTDRPDLFPDNLHPNATGARIMAEGAYRAITGDYGGLSMAPVYGSGMVLQRERPLRISGTANAGENVTVELGHAVRTASTDNQGRWTVELPPMPASRGLTMTVTAPSGKLVFDDVAVGEVWLASGQSNMAFTVNETPDAARVKEEGTDADLRFFRMQPSVITDRHKWSDDKLRAIDSLNYYLPSHWEGATPASIGPMSAVAYHFAKNLRDSLDVPVGIISNSIGGSAAESWVDIDLLRHRFPEILRDWRKNHYIQPWVQQRGGENTGTAPEDARHRHPYEPSYLFATGMKPLDSYPIQGVIWYQGESNAHNSEVFEMLFPMVVESVRTQWNSPAMPFYFVQLSGLNRPSWPAFRDSQRRLADRLDHVEMAVSHDYGDSLDVHPKVKRPIGHRLARLALRNVYGYDALVAHGPRPERAYSNAAGNIVIEFSCADGLTTSDGQAPRTFEVAQLDGIFEPATATIEGSKVILKHGLDAPVKVRYAWQPFARANLINGDSLPASTFLMVVEQPLREAEPGTAFGLSGCAGGIAGGEALIAGGCNFPVNTLAPDARKTFYRGIYHVDENGLELRGELPEPLAYAAYATVPAGIAVVGGLTPEGPVSDAWLIGEGTAVSPLPSLPVTIDNASAAAIGSTIYVIGGNMDATPANCVFSLDTSAPDATWKELKPFPGNPRIQSAVAASDGKIYVFGGFAPGPDPTLETGGLVYDPSKNRWKELPAPSQGISLGGASAASMPDGRIVFTGGVDSDIFLNALQGNYKNYLSHPAEWYRFNRYVLTYEPKSGKWSLDERDDTARAGAVLIPVDSHMLMLYGGELKPRVRTPRVSLISLQNRD